MSASTQSSTSSAGDAPQAPWQQQPEPGEKPVPPAAHPTDAFREAFSKVGELREFASYYAAARLDALKASVRNAGIYAGLVLVGFVAGASVVVVAVVLLLVGIAGALGEVFYDHPWLGDLITGVVFLAIPAIVILVGMGILTKSFRGATVRKYEQRQSQQRHRFGRDVRDEATAAGRTGRKAD